MPAPSPADDLEPIAPIAPGDDECCGNGCDPCIFDFYGYEQERYFKALREWKERQAARQAQASLPRPASSD